MYLVKCNLSFLFQKSNVQHQHDHVRTRLSSSEYHVTFCVDFFLSVNECSCMHNCSLSTCSSLYKCIVDNNLLLDRNTNLPEQTGSNVYRFLMQICYFCCYCDSVLDKELKAAQCKFESTLEYIMPATHRCLVLRHAQQ